MASLTDSVVGGTAGTKLRIVPSSRFGYITDQDTGIGVITESHVVANGTRGGVDYPVARTVTRATSLLYGLNTIAVNAPGTGMTPAATGGFGVPHPLSILTLVGGDFITPATVAVTFTKVVSYALVNGGSTSAPDGVEEVRGTTGSGIMFVMEVTVATGVVTGIASLTVSGQYNVNPTDITNELVEGVSFLFTGVRVSVVMGVHSVSVVTAGNYTSAATTSFTSTGGNNDATLNTATFTPSGTTAAATLSGVAVATAGTGAVPLATNAPTGGTQSTPVSIRIDTTKVITAAVPTAGSDYSSGDILTAVGGTFATAATFTPATLKLVGGSLAAAGTTLTTTGNITMTGGTSSTAAVLNVTSLTIGAIAVLAAGTGYQANDTVRLEGGTYTTRATLTVASSKLISMTLNAAGTGITANQVLILRDGTTTTSATATVTNIKVVSFAVNAPGTGMSPGTVLTFVNGAATFSVAATVTVATTKVVSATVAAGGSGDLGNGAGVIVEGTTGTGTKFRASVTIAANAIASVQSISVAGDYTANPTTITNEPVTYISGASSGTTLTGAQLSVVMGVNTATITNAGVFTVGATTFTSTGGGNDATLQTVVFGVNTFTISAAGSFTGSNPSALSCLGADPTFSAPVFGIGTVEITDGGIYTVGAATYTSTVLTGSGTGATFNTGTFGALAATISTAGDYTVTTGTLTHASGVQWSASWGVLTATVVDGGSYTTNASSLTTTTGGIGSGCELGTIAYGVGTATVLAGAFSGTPPTLLTGVAPLVGATFTPSYTTASIGATTVTVSSTSGMQTGFDVTFSGTNSIPSLNGTRKIEVVDATHIRVAMPLTTAATTGSVQLAAEIHRSVENVNDLYAIQGSQQVDVASLSTATRTVPTWIQFPWPNKLLQVEQFTDVGYSASAPNGTIPTPASIHYADSFQYGPQVAIRMAAGPEGKAAASIAETYSYGAPTNTESLYQIYLASGEAVLMGGSINNGVTYVVGGNNIYTVQSGGRTINYGVATIPHCLSGTVRESGNTSATLGIPTVAIRITPSSPTTLRRGQSFTWDMDVTRGILGIYKKSVVTVTMPSSGGPSGYFA